MFTKILALSLAKKIAIGAVSLISIAALAGGSPAQKPTENQISDTTMSTLQPKTELQDTNNTPVTTEPVITKKAVSITETIPFTKRTVNDPTLTSGSSKTTTKGVEGTKTKIYEVTFTDGTETSRVLKNEVVTTNPVDEVVTIGTYVTPKQVSNCDPNYSPCVPNVSYDLDCADVGFSVTVIGYDKHRLDGDDDGEGCESY